MLKKIAPFLLLVFALGCPKPEPNPSPTPTPEPTPPVPSGAYDCTQHAVPTGLVKVDQPIPGRYIVILKPTQGIAPSITAQALEAKYVGIQRVAALSNGFVVKVAPTVAGGKTIEDLANDPAVQYVQEDGRITLGPSPAPPAHVAVADWGLDRVDQRDLPLDGVYDPGDGSDGAGVNAAIIDTGITSVPDFADRLATDCFSAYGSCSDGHGHGTHVSGTVAGKTWGIAKKAELYASRVLDSSGSGSDSDVIRGVEWVTAKKKADASKDWVANMSLGGGTSPALDQAVCDSIAAGVTYAIAAGNEGANAKTSSPARVLQAITVGASDETDRKPSWSNFGPLLDLFAPGVDITSDQPGGGTATWDGTSMATPHVTGAAALYLQRHHGASPAEVVAGLISLATQGKITNGGAGSPNVLLYVRAE